MFFEEPTPPDNLEALKAVRDKSPVPISAGERLYTLKSYKDLFEMRAADYIQPDISHAGGIMELKKIAAVADAYYIPFAPHNPSGPVANAATLQIAACCPNFSILEIMYSDVDWRKDVTDEALKYKEGYIDIPNKPGLGIEIDEEECLNHPYQLHTLRHYTGALTDMLSCSALQIGMFALTLPQEKRKKYIDAAEHMLQIHECLEHRIIPDSRIRGSTLRFWEAQYDVLIYGNMFNSPHGWSAWYAYATYYLYLLTGKVNYLINTYNTLGSCLQLMSFSGELRWGFVTDPQITTSVYVPDLSKKKTDGYCHQAAKKGNFAGKYEAQTIGEQYIPMISGWYRISENKRVGGFLKCPLYFKNHQAIVENQGGCCDNDVHEIFKCLEETLLKKAFIVENLDGSLMGLECSVCVTEEEIRVTTYEEIEFLHINLHSEHDIIINGRYKFGKVKGMSMIAVNKNQNMGYCAY